MGMFGTWWLVLLQWLRIVGWGGLILLIDVIDVLTLVVSDMTGWYDWVVVVFGPHSGLVWTSTIVGWGGLIWLIGVIDVLTSTVTQLLMYLMQSNFRLLWNVKCTNASQYGEYMSVVHCTLYDVHCTLRSAVSWQQMWLESRIDGFCGSVHL